MGVYLTQTHEIAQNHQALNMVTVTIFEGFFDGIIDGFDAGGTVIKRTRQCSFVLKKVCIAFFDTIALIHNHHELAPADDLADKPFERGKRHIVFGGKLECVVHHFTGGNQADIERRR